MLLIVSATQAMDQIQWHENPETSQFLSIVNSGDVNLSTCSARTQEELDEALYNAVYFNQMNALHTLLDSGANPKSIAAKHAYIKAMLNNNTIALNIFAQYQVCTYSYEQAFILAIEHQSADLVNDFMTAYATNTVLSENIVKLALKKAVETENQYIFNLLIKHLDKELKSYALFLATKYAITTYDNSLAIMAIKEGLNKNNNYCSAALMLALTSDNIQLRRLLFAAGIIPQKTMSLRSTKQRYPSRKLQTDKMQIK